MHDESAGKTVQVALGLCLVCSLLVSGVAVSLHSRQEENKRLDTIANILVAADLYQEGSDVSGIYAERVTAVLVDLETGTEVPIDTIDEAMGSEEYNISEVAADPLQGRPLTRDEDVARIGRIPRRVWVYLVRRGDTLEKVVLPVYGKGLWSTMYGFLALEGDIRTVSGISFYEHGETPGLGGEIDNPRWQAIWKGKRALDDSGAVKIEVVKGSVDPSGPRADHQVDGLSGATITTRGLDLMARFWLGDGAYGPYLKTLRETRDE